MKASAKCPCSGAMWCLLSLASIVIPLACDAASHETPIEKNQETYFLLGLVGYNYTDRYIDSYSVNGADGGFVRLSSPTSGGSGIACCGKLSKQYAGKTKATVRWQVDGCVYLIKDERTGKADKVIHSYFKEKEVDVERAVSNTPAYLETHFYPDGSVRVQVSEHPSVPRFILDKKRPDKSLYPRCKDDKQPRH